MNTAFQFLRGLLILSLFFSVFFLAYCLRHRMKRGTRGLLLLFTGISIWLVSDLIQMHTGPDPLAFGGIVLRFLGVELTVIGVFVFCLEYTNRDHWLTPGLVGLLFAKAVLVVGLLASPYRWLFLQVDTSVDPATFPWGYELLTTPLYVANTGYNISLVVAGVVLVILTLSRSTQDARGQFSALLLAFLTPFILNALFALKIVPFDLTPSGFLVTASVLLYASFRLRLLDSMPIARQTVIEQMDEMMFVLDESGQIETVNAAVHETFGHNRDFAGTSVTAFLGEDIEAIVNGTGPDTSAAGDDNTFTTTIDGETRHFAVNHSLLTDHSDTVRGRLLVCRDLTAQTRERRRLRRQNARLDRFASMISHDLRNPLSVARAKVDIARESRDPAHFDDLRQAHHRMDTMIDDMLALARSETTVEDREVVAFRDLVEMAWGMLRTPDAELQNEVPADWQLACAPDLVQNVLENLFRNAIQHNEDDVTVHVGPLSDKNGFFVEDDGSGITVDDLGAIFEYGQSGSETGMGVGLAIVADLVEAHGWEISVEDGTRGGARFEIVTEPSRAGIEA
jgi:PAS domain S-box-containing protein